MQRGGPNMRGGHGGPMRPNMRGNFQRKLVHDTKGVNTRIQDRKLPPKGDLLICR